LTDIINKVIINITAWKELKKKCLLYINLVNRWLTKQMITEINSNMLDKCMLLEVSVPGNWDFELPALLGRHPIF
jgi:hypothetical protein